VNSVAGRMVGQKAHHLGTGATNGVPRRRILHCDDGDGDRNQSEKQHVVVAVQKKLVPEAHMVIRSSYHSHANDRHAMDFSLHPRGDAHAHVHASHPVCGSTTLDVGGSHPVCGHHHCH